MLTLKKRRLRCLFVLLFFFAVESVAWFYNLEIDHYSFKPNDKRISVYPENIAYTSGYDISEDRFVPTDEDPQLCFALDLQTVSSLVIELNKPLEEDAVVELFYSRDGNLTEKKKISQIAKKGDTSVIFSLKPSEYCLLRIDFNSAFDLKDVTVSSTGVIPHYVLNRRIWARLLFEFVATALFVIIVYAIHENKQDDKDPIIANTGKFLSKNIPYEKLSFSERAFLLLCLAFYFGWSLVFLNPYYGPDEMMRYDVPLYIFNNNALPFGGEPELIHPYWGTSYGFSLTLPYFLNVLFMKLVSLFTLNSNAIWVAARFTSVLSGLGIAYFSICITKRITNMPTRWFFIIPMSLTPQIVFISSYINLDSFSLFTVVFLIYIWLVGMQNNWNIRSCIWFGIGLGLCLVSYQFAYPFVLGSFFLYCVWHIVHRKQVTFKRFILHGLIIVGVVFLVSGWYFIRNAYLYNGDIFAINASKPYAEMYAAQEQKPSFKHTYRVQGYSVPGMLKNSNWVDMTLKSVFYILGGMNWLAPQIVYKCLKIAVVLAIIGCLYGLIVKKYKFKNDYLIALMLMAFSSALVVCLSLYYSWSGDYQPQGRYIITVLPFVYVLVAYGLHNLLNIFVRNNRFFQRCASGVLLSAFVVLDITATFNCLSHIVY